MTRQNVNNQSAPRNRAWVLLLAVAAAGAVLWCAGPYGLGAEPDTAAYLSAARSLAHGGALVVYNGRAFADWPPLIPILLALFERAGISGLAAFKYLNAGAIAVTIVCAGTWISRRIADARLRNMAAAATVISIPLGLMALYALSETLFLCLTVASLVQMDAYLHTPSRRALARLTLIVAAACLCRYIGVTLLPCGCLIILAARAPEMRGKVGRAALFALGAVLPVTLWCARNLVLTQTLLGGRYPSDTGLLENTLLASDVMTQWVLPERLPFWIRLGVCGGIALILLICAVRAIRNARSGRAAAEAILAPVAFCLCYGGFLIASASCRHMDALDDRLLSPLYIPLLMTMTCCTDAAGLLRPVGAERGGGLRFGTAARLAVPLFFLL